MNEERVVDLTIDQLKQLIRETVQLAMTEVLIEFAAAAEIDAKLTYEAEMADYLRTSLQGRGVDSPDIIGSWDVDD